MDWLAIKLGIEGEGGKTLRLFLLLFWLSLASAAMKAAQTGIFLSRHGREAIPWAFALSSVVLAAVASWMVAETGRRGPVRVAVGSLSGGAAAVVGLWLLLGRGVEWGPFAAYVVLDVVQALVTLHGWGLVGEAVTPRSARVILPLVGVGANGAWVASGAAMPWLLSHAGAAGLLPIVGVILATGAAGVSVVASRDVQERAPQRAQGGLVEGWSRGFLAVRAAPLLTLWAALVVVAMMAEVLVDYALMVAVRSEGADGAKIAVFFGRYYGVTSALSVLMQLGATQALLGRLGAAGVIALHGSLSALAGAGALLAPGLMAVAGLRGTLSVGKFTMTSPALSQVLTPLSSVTRSQGQSLVKGVLAPLVCAGLGLLLAALPAGVSTRWLLGGAVALITLGLLLARGLLKPLYRDALRSSLDTRRLDLLGSAGVVGLGRDAASELSAELSSGDPDRALLALEILRLSPGHSSSVQLALQNPSSEVREEAIKELAASPWPQATEALAAHLPTEREPALRRRVAEALLAAASPAGRACLRGLVGEEDEVIGTFHRLVVAEDRGPEALGAELAGALASGSVERRRAALRALPESIEEGSGVALSLRGLLAERDDDLCIEALRAVARARLRSCLDQVESLLLDPRSAAAAVVAVAPWGEERDRLLASALGRASSHTRERVARCLAQAMIEGKIGALPRALVEPLLREQALRSYGLYAVLAGLTHDDGAPDWELSPAFRYLGGEIELALREGQRHLLHLLRLWESDRLLRALELGLGRPTEATLARTAELIETTLEPELARLVAPLFDRSSLRAKIDVASGLGILEREALRDPLAAVVALDDLDLTGAAMLGYGERFASRYPEIYERNAAMIPLFERMRALRAVSLFSELARDDLRALAECVTPAEFSDGHVLFRKGDRGDDLVILLEGTLSIREDGREINRCQPPEAVGELAVLDGEPRSADAVCEGTVRLLRLRGEDLAELLARRPGVQERVLMMVLRRMRAMMARK